MFTRIANQYCSASFTHSLNGGASQGHSPALNFTTPLNPFQSLNRMSASHVHFFFHMREQVKLYHWQTHSYSRHKATDEVLEKLDKNIDEFVEVFMGKYGRPRMTPKTATIRVANLTEVGAVKFIKACIQELQGPITKSLDAKRDTDLLNIRDEMTGDLNQLLYLFTLK